MFSDQFYTSNSVLFVDIFIILALHFIQLRINDVLKSDLVSVVTAYTVCFLCFCLLWNISNLPIFRKACLHGRINENMFYWKFKRKFRMRKFSVLCSSRCEIFFRMRSILGSRILGERQENARGTLTGTLQDCILCWFFC